MEFFDELGKKASKTYKAAAEKTGKFAKEAKFKMIMSDNKSKIEDLYQEIGKKVYEKHIREEEIDIDEYLIEKCSEIDVLSDEIESIREEILDLKDRKKCKSCDYEIDIEYHYCPNCGAKQETEDKQEEARDVEVLEKEENE